MLDWLLIWNSHKKSIWHCSTQNNEKHQISITKYHCNPFYQEITHKYDVINESVNCLYCWTHIVIFLSFFSTSVRLSYNTQYINKPNTIECILYIYSVELSKKCMQLSKGNKRVLPHSLIVDNEARTNIPNR